MKNKPDTFPAGVIGAGSFGTVIANILAENQEVLLYTRRPETAAAMQASRSHKNVQLHERIRIVSDIREVATTCKLLFPVVPSAGFRNMCREFTPFLTPEHILIHATKGLDVLLPDGKPFNRLDSAGIEHLELSRENVKTMTEVLSEETPVVRIGCLSGPNLAGELSAKQPAATVVASRFDEVIREGQNALKSSRFKVFGTHDVLGAEMGGVLKNIMAIASGILNGLGYGENARAMLITRGLAEMAYVGVHLGAEKKAFFGLSGIGDLIATCSSPLSRNFSVGFRLAKGEKLQDILNSMNEAVEGLNTLKVTKALTDHYKIRAPITQTLYRLVYEKTTVEAGMKFLMEYPFNVDVDFI